MDRIITYHGREDGTPVKIRWPDGTAHVEKIQTAWAREYNATVDKFKRELYSDIKKSEAAKI